MADVRSLLKSERAARRIEHPHATYSTTGTLVCLVCQVQLKSETLWAGHLRSPQHSMRSQKLRDEKQKLDGPTAVPELEQDDAGRREGARSPNESVGNMEIGNKKRKADDPDNHIKKRVKSGPLPVGFFDEGMGHETETPKSKAISTPENEIQLPSRPATPLKTLSVTPPQPPMAVNEDEWAAFEADIAATEAPAPEGTDAVISAPAVSAAELEAKSRNEEEATLKSVESGDKDDAVRRLEEEFEQMEELEQRVNRLKEKREALRLASEKRVTLPEPAVVSISKTESVDEDEDEEEEDDDDWDGFRLKA